MSDELAVASAVIHVLGYLTYILFVRRGLIDANPLSWLMFAYGTGLLTFLEFRSGAGWQELLLPIACSISSIVVAALCLRLAKIRRVELPDIMAFALDVVLTAAYVAVWILHSNGLDPNLESLAVIALLVCANATTLASFVPILRSTLRRPQDERALPWLLWTLAYGMLFVVTLRDVSDWERLTLLIYPALNAILHFAIAVFAMSRWWRASTRVPFEVRHTGKTGLGLFTPREYARGERVFVLSGKIHWWKSATGEDARKNENWFGVGRDKWIEPDPPYMFINHSCEPNLGVSGERDFVALRDIAQGEELTFDYSITEDEDSWSMACACGAAACRGQIGPVQTLPLEVMQRYLPHVGAHFQRIYFRNRPPAERGSDVASPLVNAAAQQTGRNS